MDDQQRREEECRGIYDEAQRFFAELAQEIPIVETAGFEVLYGPPTFKCPVLLLGLQPGGAERSEVQGLWPKECEYAHGTWPLARRLQDILGADFLMRCTGLNAIFLRAPRFGVYRSEVPRSARKRVLQFCLPRAEQLVRLLKPKLVVGLGLQTLELFGRTATICANERGRRLATEGEVGGRPAVAMLHPTGARIAGADRAAIASILHQRLPRM